MSRSIWPSNHIGDVCLWSIMCRFLLVSLNIEAILGEVTIGQRRKKLEEMARGNGLSDAYTATLARLKGQKGNKSVLGLKVLIWVVYSRRPLRASELCHALAVEFGSLDLDPKNVPALRTLLASCLGLVTIEASSSTVRLVHFTLQEHLLSNTTLFHSPHVAIAEVCLTYLNFRSVLDLLPTLSSAPSTMPLLEYSSLYWGKHLSMGMTENVKMLALRLLDRFDEHISAQLLLLHYNEDRGPGPYFDSWGGPTGFSGLHGVSFLGITEIVVAVLEMKEWDVNATDCVGGTALTWAAMRGNGEVVSILLKRGDVNLDQPDTDYGRTPLSWASVNGHEEVVKMLLEREGVNPNQTDTSDHWTPLLHAVWHRKDRVVKVLLEREDVNPNQADSIYGRTPLWCAAGCGFDELVRMLLEREDVDPNQTDAENGWTPLLWATLRMHKSVVKMLLGREDVNPNYADSIYGQTPLWWAAERGYDELAMMLLEREDIDLNQADTVYGQTPLSCAAWWGNVNLVKMLTERNNVRIAMLDNYNQTPLSLALSRGHDEVVRILQGNTNSHPIDRRG